MTTTPGMCAGRSDSDFVAGWEEQWWHRHSCLRSKATDRDVCATDAQGMGGGDDLFFGGEAMEGLDRLDLARADFEAEVFCKVLAGEFRGPAAREGVVVDDSI